MILLEPGTLWQRVLSRTEEAFSSGALEPIATEGQVMKDGGVSFIVRMVANPERKRTAQATSGVNPFLPYDEDLFVALISDTHVCLLNKYNVLPHHILIVTRAFEEQEHRLTLQDFAALWACLDEIDGLVFYNAGTEAGASQRHKHLQLVPVPLGAGPQRSPMDAVLPSVTTLLPFRHAVVPIADLARQEPAARARASLELYGRFLTELGLDPEAVPYNLLLTRDWMFVVPRSRGRCESLEVNALGFAGSLLARNDRQVDVLRRHGPMEVLRRVSVPRHP